MVYDILTLYAKVYTDLLAIPVVKGVRLIFTLLIFS